MHIKSFKVKNFKSIKESGFLTLDDFNTFIGKNDAGKSSFLEALTIFLKKDKPSSEHFHKQQEDEIVFEAVVEDISEELTEAFNDDYYSDDEQLNIKRVFNKRSGTTPGADTYVNGEKLSKGAIKEDGERLTKAKSRDFIWEELPRAIFVPAERNVSEETKLKGGTFLSDIVMPILEEGGIEGDNNIEQARNNLERKLNEASDELGDKLAKNMKQHMPDLEDVNVNTGSVSIKKAISPNIRLQDQYLPDSVDINERGSGVGSLFILSLMQTYVDMQLGEGYYLLFEEPGNWLHPGAERKMLETLKEIADEGGKILISTHSQVFIDRKEEGNMYLVRREDGESDYEKIEEEAFRAVEEIGARNSDLLQSDFVIYVEGPSDAQIIKEIGSHLDGWDSNNITVQYLGGTGNLKYCEPEELRKINRKLAFLLDSDRKEKGDSPNSTAEDLKESCEKLGIDCKILERRSIENYFSSDAVAQVFGFDEIDEDFVGDYDDVPENIKSKIGDELIDTPGVEKGDFSKTSHGIKIVGTMYDNGESIDEIEDFLRKCIDKC
jgi:putative ATP-dependent endonuclease of OLD family